MRRGFPKIRRCAAVAGGLCALAGGCDWEPKPDAKGIFDYISPEVTPLQAAEMADNPYDANDRYRGTLMLANAYYAGEPVYIALFERRIVDPDANVRSAGARGLANHGEPRHVPLLVKALRDDPDAFVRREAARGLQRLHGEEAVPPLVKSVNVKTELDKDVRIAAAAALGQYPEPNVLDSLIAAVEEDPQLAVNAAALDSLKTLTGENFGLNRAAWVKWREAVSDPFAGRRPYIYPVFERGKYFYEYLPFTPDPPNEVPGPPVGMPADLREPAKPENAPSPGAAPASGQEPGSK